MDKEKLKKIIKLITPDQDKNLMDEDFSNGWNACLKNLERMLDMYLETLD